VIKINKDEYQTVMEGSKFKMGHRRPYWKNWSYAYPGQLTYRQKLIQILKETLEKLEQEEETAKDSYGLQPPIERELINKLCQKSTQSSSQ
jgi:hypothetical protein